ncbi:putative post-transcriptional gene silencing PAZ-Argonaute family protein [Helianthus annuus]|nr:putative post-transcriptional gene silencing PAZ-Argonaute family protein [Helianthus annuus]KAJ0921608.1 putative post-transcriptional gene silencing PAZ-Argonaute family protein [Helianthus annuus]
MGLSLNIDMSARAFYENKLVSEFVKEFLNKDQERIKVKRALQGVRVEVHHGDSVRRYKCQDLTVNQLTN